MRIWDLAMSRSYAHFSVFTPGIDGLDPVSMSPIMSGQLFIVIMQVLQAVLYCTPIFLGYVALVNGLVTWESIVTSSLAWAILM